MSFRKLLAWQKAYELALGVYTITKDFPKNEMYGLSLQMRRASASISANIAEGYERQHRKEYLQHLFIARGSLGEVETYLSLAKDLGYNSIEKFEALEKLRAETARLLKGLINSLS
ncbi:MAG: four helix bundle protein [Candidatus Zixiibacteriota bacterium]